MSKFYATNYIAIWLFLRIKKKCETTLSGHREPQGMCEKLSSVYLGGKWQQGKGRDNERTTILGGQEAE